MDTKKIIKEKIIEKLNEIDNVVGLLDETNTVSFNIIEIKDLLEIIESLNA
jgi:hypothetical protein